MRPIDADALISFIDMGHLRNPHEACYSERDVVDMLESRPTLTLDDLRPKGRWIAKKEGFFQKEVYICSNCESRNGLGYPFNYCYNCGADMRGGGEDA